MKHVVVAIINRENPLSYLLVSSKKDHGEYSGFYYPPGGHVEDGDVSTLSALERELKEELSLTLSKAKLLVETAGDVQDQKTSWFLCEVQSSEYSMNKEELLDAGYFTREQMNELNIWPATEKVFREYIFKS